MLADYELLAVYTLSKKAVECEQQSATVLYYFARSETAVVQCLRSICGHIVTRVQILLSNVQF